MERYIISQHKMQKRIEEEERRAKEMATPSINSKYKLHQAVTRQEDSSLDNTELNKRMQSFKEKKYEDKECTFKPKINKNANVEARHQTHKSKYLTKNREIIDSNCTFKPTVDSKSKEI